MLLYFRPCGELLASTPTAQALVDELASTPWSQVYAVPGLGLVWTAQWELSLRSMRVLLSPTVSPAWPTAQPLDAEVITRAASVSLMLPTKGSFLTLHCWPFQCSSSA